MLITDWHDRYEEQARWTQPLRHFILTKIPIQSNWSVLELGCGTGAILQDFNLISERVVGLDRDLDALVIQGVNQALLVNADAENPPFQENFYDLIYCHYFLLWLKNPVTVIEAAKRLLKPSGYLAVFAEPDYTSRQTAPETLIKLADLQNKSLVAQGAYLDVGRQLGKLLIDSGFDLQEFGSINEAKPILRGLTESEKNILRSDWEFLARTKQTEITKAELEELLLLKTEHWYVPTYYALAKLKK